MTMNDPQEMSEQPREHIIYVRALISTRDAGLLIGPGGKAIQEMRDMTNARLRIGEVIPDARDRVVSISGNVKSVSMALRMMMARMIGGSSPINGDNNGEISRPSSNSATLRLLVPHQYMGAVIGKQGQSIRAIQELSNARISASDQLLPNSTDRLVLIRGGVDQIEIAAEKVCEILHGVASSQAERQAGHVAYTPIPDRRPRVPMGGDRVGGVAVDPNAEIQSQQIHIPSDLVGAIIGHGGRRIRDIRMKTGTNIKIADPEEPDSTERLVTVTGSADAIKGALYMIVTRLEQEKQRAADKFNEEDQSEIVA